MRAALKNFIVSVRSKERDQTGQSQLGLFYGYALQLCSLAMFFPYFSRHSLTPLTQAESEAKCVGGFWLVLVCCRDPCCARSPDLSPCPASCLDTDRKGRFWVESPPGDTTFRETGLNTSTLWKSDSLILETNMSLYVMDLAGHECVNIKWAFLCVAIYNSFHSVATLIVCRVVTLSRAMALSSFLSSTCLMYISYSSWRWGGTGRLWSGTHRDTIQATWKKSLCFKKMTNFQVPIPLQCTYTVILYIYIMEVFPHW